MPYTCFNDPKFTYRVVSTNYIKFFPPQNALFNCHTMAYIKEHSNKTSSDALMYLPNSKAYYSSVITLSFGLFVGIVFLVCSIRIKIPKVEKYQMHYDHLLKEVKSLNYEVCKMKENDQADEDDRDYTLENEETIATIGMSEKYKNNLTLYENISRNNKDLRDRDKEIMNRLGYRIGRVGYVSCTKFNVNGSISARSSIKSLSNKGDSNSVKLKPVFFLNQIGFVNDKDTTTALRRDSVNCVEPLKNSDENYLQVPH